MASHSSILAIRSDTSLCTAPQSKFIATMHKNMPCSKESSSEIPLVEVAQFTRIEQFTIKRLTRNTRNKGNELMERRRFRACHDNFSKHNGWIS